MTKLTTKRDLITESTLRSIGTTEYETFGEDPGKGDSGYSTPTHSVTVTHRL